MSKMTETATDLAATLSAASQEQDAAAALERQAAEQRAKAEAALAKAQAEQEAARLRWEEGVLAAYPDRRTAAHAALADAETSWQSAADVPTEVMTRWMARESARAALFAVELRREKAAHILGHGSRPAKAPRPDFAGDVATLLNGWSMERLSAEEERVRESQAAATTGRVSSDA